MRSFNMDELAEEFGGEYVLGKKDLHSEACYLVYGRLDPGEKERLIKPCEDHEEILCAVEAPLVIRAAGGETILNRGDAVHVTDKEPFHISNPADRPVIYVLAGGRRPQTSRD